MMRPGHSPISWREACRILSQHRRKAAGCFLTVLGLTALVTLLSPRAYRSEAKLLVRLGRENAALDPTVTLGQAPVVAVPPSRENEISSVVEILKSRVLAERVVDAISPRVILGDAPLGTEVPPADERERERAVTRFYKVLGVEAAKKSNVIVLTYEAPSPELARAVVAKLTECYLDWHVHLNRTPRAHEFLAEQTAQLGSQLAHAEDALRDLKNETGLAAPEAQRQILVTRIGRLEDELLQTSGALTAAEAEVRVLGDKLAGLAQTQVTAQTQGFPNQAADLMKGQLYTLQLREQELLAKYPEQHPEVKQIRQQVAAAQAILSREEGARQQVTQGPSRTHEDAELALLRQEPVLAALRAKAHALRTQLGRERDSLKRLNDNLLRIGKLQREQELTESSYRKYAEGLEQTRIDQALEAERISNLSIAQPATYEIKPVRPRLLLNLALGLFLAVCGAAGLALAAEYRDPSGKTPALIERRLEVPALATAPRGEPETPRLNGESGSP